MHCIVCNNHTTYTHTRKHYKASCALRLRQRCSAVYSNCHIQFQDDKLTKVCDLSSDFIMYVLRACLASCTWAIKLVPQLNILTIYLSNAKCSFPCQRPVIVCLLGFFFTLSPNSCFISFILRVGWCSHSFFDTQLCIRNISSVL